MMLLAAVIFAVTYILLLALPKFRAPVALLGGAVHEFVAPHVLQRLQQKVGEDTQGA